MAHYPLTHVLLIGAAAAAVGLSLSMGITTARRVPRRAGPLLVMVATFIAVGLLHWPLLWTVIGFGTISVGLVYRSLEAAA